MNVEDIDPRAAHERWLADSRCVYLDVRTPAEFESGHPSGAFNVPIALPGPGGMAPNPEFAAACESLLARDAPALVGCRSGPRSRRACGVLLGLGFAEVVNVAGGFVGQVDEATLTVLVPGWQALGLPVSRTPEPGRSWAEIRARLATT